MEADRYQKNHTLFIVGMISLLIGLCFMVFGLYLFPNLIFGWRYEVPGFIPVVKEWLQSSYHYSEAGAAQFIFFFLFLIGLLLIIVAYFSSNRIDNDIYSAELKAEAPPRKIKNSGISDAQRLALKILFISLLVFIFIKVFEWLIYTPPPASQLNQVRRITNH